MHRNLLFAALALCSACAAHHELRGLDDVTTTSAVIRPPSEARMLETVTATYEAQSSTAPTPLAAIEAGDARAAGSIETAVAAAEDRAELALGHAKEGRVQQFAQLVHDRMHEAKLRLGFANVAPGRPTQDDRLTSLAAQSQIDFDRAYVDFQMQEIGAMIRQVDAAAAAVKNVELEKRLIDLRPMLDDLYERAWELRQILAH